MRMIFCPSLAGGTTYVTKSRGLWLPPCRPPCTRSSKFVRLVNRTSLCRQRWSTKSSSPRQLSAVARHSALLIRSVPEQYFTDRYTIEPITVFVSQQVSETGAAVAPLPPHLLAQAGNSLEKAYRLNGYIPTASSLLPKVPCRS